jgi:Predicted restriction endonuclease
VNLPDRSFPDRLDLLAPVSEADVLYRLDEPVARALRPLPAAPPGAPGRRASSTPDSDAVGEPVVSNGVALCKLHHAAFDRFFFTIRPDYVIEVRPSVLRESDGPMLVVGLQQINGQQIHGQQIHGQQIHGQQIHLPRRLIDLPDRARLERRYEQFGAAAG